VRPLQNLDLVKIALVEKATPEIHTSNSTPKYKRFISEEIQVIDTDAPEQVDFSTNLCDTYRKTKASFEEKVEQSLKYLTTNNLGDEPYQIGRR
jgi:hypothetical protein